MGLLNKLVEKRALKEARALKETHENCERKIADLDVQIAELAGQKDQATQKFYSAEDRHADVEAARFLKKIKAYESSVKSLRGDQAAWAEVVAILLQIETSVVLLQQHKQYLTIVKAIPYRKLKRENLNSATISDLIDDFVEIYKKLREAENRFAQQNAKFAKELRHVDRLADNQRDIQDLNNSEQIDALKELRRELLNNRKAEKSSIEPVETTDNQIENKDNFA